MLRIFRGKRSELVQKGNFRKVALYAIGEIILVVIGILLAVRINNWNQNSKLLEMERVTLERLKEDLQYDFDRYDFLDSALTVQIDKCTEVINGLRNHETIEERVELAGRAFLTYYLLEPNTITYDEMRNTGRLYSLSDQKLRQDILTYYRQVEKWAKYREKDNNQMRSLEGQPRYNDFKLIRRNLLENRQVTDAEFKWLAERNSREMKDWEALAITTRGNYWELRNTVRFLRDVYCKRAIEGLERVGAE